VGGVSDFGIRNGYYKHADRMNVLDAAQRDRTKAFYQRQLAALAQFEPSSLDASHRIELVIMKGRFERSLFELETFRSWQWQPSTYNVANEIDLLVTTEYAPLDTRLRHVMARLERIPAYYAAATANIADPTVEHTQLAILQNKGALTVLGPELAKKADASGLSSAEKSLFAQRLEAARGAIADTSPGAARWRRSSRADARAASASAGSSTSRNSTTTSSRASPPRSSMRARSPRRQPFTTPWRSSLGRSGPSTWATRRCLPTGWC
jgi:uncharacterized protein (DUF885 family)